MSRRSGSSRSTSGRTPPGPTCSPCSSAGSPSWRQRPSAAGHVGRFTRPRPHRAAAGRRVDQPARQGLGGRADRRARRARRRGVPDPARPGRGRVRTGHLLAVGVGELPARLERLRRQLASEGLFSPERKRAIPFLPGVIGLICGRDSAAQRDVQQNAGRRWPAVRFRVEQTAVQGQYAVEEITDALRRLDEDPEVDVIVIARGGGSLEDLLPFSDESLVRAVAACRTPVVSAIGHEQDSPLLDLVADLRASTPTDAAKRIVPDVAEQAALITQLRDRARRCVTGWLDRETAWLAAVRSRPALADPVREIERQSERVDALLQRARMSLTASLARAGDDVAHTQARLLALSPASTLRRGYAIVQHRDDGVVRGAAEVKPGELLTVRFAEDQLTVRAGDDGAGG